MFSHLIVSCSRLPVMTNLAALALYLSTVLSVVSPRLNRARRDSITRDIATVTLSNDRAFEDDANGQKTALLLVSIAYYETGKSWASWVDDGRCNDPEWRSIHGFWLRRGGCDSAGAWSMWQVHPPGDDPRIGRSYVTNRQNGIRAALFIARKSLQTGVGLCGYSGEMYPNCPKADHRLEKAKAWAIKFPFAP